MMRASNQIVLAFLQGGFFSVPAQAAEGSIRIISPANGATVDSSAERANVFYYASFDPKGDHVHLSVDGKEKETLRELEISHVTDLYQKGHWVPVMREINGTKPPLIHFRPGNMKSAPRWSINRMLPSG